MVKKRRTEVRPTSGHGVVSGSESVQHLIDGFHNRDLRAHVVDLLGALTTNTRPVR